MTGSFRLRLWRTTTARLRAGHSISSKSRSGGDGAERTGRRKCCGGIGMFFEMSAARSQRSLPGRGRGPWMAGSRRVLRSAAALGPAGAGAVGGTQSPLAWVAARLGPRHLVPAQPARAVRRELVEASAVGEAGCAQSWADRIGAAAGTGWAIRSRLEAMKKVARLIKRHRERRDRRGADEHDERPLRGTNAKIQWIMRLRLPQPPALPQRSLVFGMVTVATAAVIGATVVFGQPNSDSQPPGASTPSFATVFFAAFGVVVAAGLALQKIVEWRRAYVTCSLEMSDVNGCAVAKLALEGRSVFRRKVRWACLVVSRQGTDFLALIRKHLDSEVQYTNDVIRLQKAGTPTGDRFIEAAGLCVIPLPFFYSEQLGIRDEKITYSVLLNHGFAVGYYDVRFFVFPPKRSTNRFGYHRCIHTVHYLGTRSARRWVTRRGSSGAGCRRA